MAESFVASLKRLAREKRGLREKERQVARFERRLVDYLGRALSGTGYHLLPIASAGAQQTTTNHRARVKRLRCPKCDRRFSHRLPMARHMSATHGTRRKARAATTKTNKK